MWRQKLAVLVLISWGIAGSFLPSFMSPACASNLRVEVDGLSVSIRADDALLSDILKELSQKAGLKLTMKDVKDEKLNCSMNTLPVEEAVRRILGARSYSLTFKSQGKGEFVPSELRVLGRKGEESHTLTHTPPTPNAAMGEMGHDESDDHPPPDQHQIKISRESFTEMFGMPEAITETFSAVPTHDEVHQTGIRMKEVDEDGVLRLLGIGPGDVIEDVNGMPVRSPDELPAALKSVPADQSILRIERRRTTGLLDPIYIDLGQPPP